MLIVAPGKFTSAPVNKSVMFTEQGTLYLKVTFMVSQLRVTVHVLFIDARSVSSPTSWQHSSRLCSQGMADAAQGLSSSKKVTMRS